MLGIMTLFKTIILIIIIGVMTAIIIIILVIIPIIISTTIFQNITEKLEKMTYFVFTILGVLLPPKVCHMPPTGKKRCYKITTGHK